MGKWNTSSVAAGMLWIFAQFSFAAAVPDPTESTDEWPRSSLKQANLSAKAIHDIETRLADQSWPGISSVLIVRRGKLAYEHYAAEVKVDTLHDIRSASKTLNALLIGAAIDRGLIRNVQQPIHEFFPDYQAQIDSDPRKRQITLADLLTMSSLLECNDDNPWSAGNEERMYVTEDWLGFALALPIKGFAPWQKPPQDSPHGRSFAYCSAGSFVLGAVLERASKQSLAEFSRQVLEQPLGITTVQWNRSPLGIGIGAGGTRFRSRDLARLGELILRKGRWNDQQVIAADWIEQMTTVHAQARDDADYGYQIWRFEFEVGQQRLATWAMSGNGGNYVFIQPQLDLVVVISSRAYNQGSAHANSQALFKAVLADLTD